MVDKEQITQVIYRAMDEINQQLPKSHQLEKSPETPLLKSKNLDSLNLVNFILFTEEAIEDEFGILVNIADQDVVSQDSSPFNTVSTLADYISTRLQEA